MNSQIVKLETSLVNMKWAAIILCLFMALPCWAFPVHTNYSVLRPFDAEGPEFNQFFWNWSGFDDQQIVADVADITFSNASFRVTYPARGDIYLDVATTNFITTFRTSVVSIVNEVFTTCYIKITYTNIFYATTNKTITESRYVDFYTNQTVSPVTLTALVASTTASNQIGTNSASSCVISTGTAPTTALAAYGLYTNTWFGGTNLTTWTTNTIFLQVYSSNYVADGQFVNANSATTLWSFVGATAINQRAQNIQMVTNCTAYLPVTTPSVEVGKTYRIYFLFTKSADSTYTGTGTSIVCGVTNTHTANGYNVITNTATIADGFTFKWGSTNATGYTYIDDVVIQEYVSGRTNAAVGATTNTLVHSNLVVETYPATTHTNTLYTIESNNYQRVVITFSRTNLPPDGPYFGEILAYGGATTETRSVGKGQISVDHSLYANTNQSGWTNPTAGSMIGPPGHTLTTLSGWPFPSSIIITNGSSTTGHIADGVLDISISQTVSSSETQTLVSVLQLGNSAGTNNINMNTRSITNVGSIETTGSVTAGSFSGGNTGYSARIGDTYTGPVTNKDLWAGIINVQTQINMGTAGMLFAPSGEDVVMGGIDGGIALTNASGGADTKLQATRFETGNAYGDALVAFRGLFEQDAEGIIAVFNTNGLYEYAGGLLTVSNGITRALRYYGDGSGLTNLPAAATTAGVDSITGTSAVSGVLIFNEGPGIDLAQTNKVFNWSVDGSELSGINGAGVTGPIALASLGNVAQTGLTFGVTNTAAGTVNRSGSHINIGTNDSQGSATGTLFDINGSVGPSVTIAGGANVTVTTTGAIINIAGSAGGSGATQAIATVGSSTVTSTISGATLSWSNAAAAGGSTDWKTRGITNSVEGFLVYQGESTGATWSAGAWTKLRIAGNQASNSVYDTGTNYGFASGFLDETNHSFQAPVGWFRLEGRWHDSGNPATPHRQMLQLYSAGQPLTNNTSFYPLDATPGWPDTIPGRTMAGTIFEGHASGNQPDLMQFSYSYYNESATNVYSIYGYVSSITAQNTYTFVLRMTYEGDPR